MATSDQQPDEQFSMRTIETVIRVGLLLLLLIWCFQILQPFIVPVVWGVIIAVAIYPVYIKLLSILGGRNRLASIVYTLVMLALLITPTLMVSESLYDTWKEISVGLEQGSLVIPPPEEKVKELPLVGDEVYDVWKKSSANLQSTIKEYRKEIKQAAGAVVSVITGASSNILKFIVSIIISGVLLANASGAYELTQRIFRRLIGNVQGAHFAKLSGEVILSVAHGVLGIAILQAIFAAIGMYVMDVPAWGLWTVLILFLAVLQLPPLVVLGPVIFYVFAVAELTPALIFMIWSVSVGISDTFLKPLFLGRGVDTPMLVILLGAIGGAILSGLIGLFVGAVVLALVYELFMAWLNNEPAPVGGQE